MHGHYILFHIHAHRHALSFSPSLLPAVSSYTLVCMHVHTHMLVHSFCLPTNKLAFSERKAPAC